MGSKKSIQERKKLIECDVIKTIMMLFVVLGHSASLWATSGWFVTAPVYPSVFLGLIADWLGSFHIYCFVLVSGYIFAYLKYECGKYNNWKQFIYAKFWRLIIPYFFVSLLWCAPFYYFFYKCGFSTIIKRFILGTGPSQLWFLLMLFQVFLYAYIFSDLFIKKTKLLAVIALFMYAISIIGNTIVQNYYQIFTSMQFYLCFFVGMCLRYYKVKWTKEIHLLMFVLVDLSLFGINIVLNHQNTLICKILNLGCSCLLHLMGAIMAFFVIYRFTEKIGIYKLKLFQLLEEHSFTIYLFHQQIIYICIYFLNGKVNNYLLFISNFIVSIVFSLFISIILKNNKFTKRLVGE